MIYGAKSWNNREAFYVQTNNPTEEILRKAGIKSYYETCGPTAAINCLAAMERNITIETPGGYRPQPEEVLNDYLNDPRNYSELKKAREEIDPRAYMGNQIAQYYPVAIEAVFGARSQFLYARWDKITDYLKEGYALQLCFIKPGHFIAAVAYDDETKEIIYNDSMGKYNVRMGKGQEENLKNYCIVYY